MGLLKRNEILDRRQNFIVLLNRFANMLRPALKHFVGVIFIFSFALIAKAQQTHFVYLQTENSQPFYVKINNKVMSSSPAGYLILSKLQDGDHKLNVGFPKREFPEEHFQILIDKNNLGFLLKNFGEKGWGLFNMQSYGVVMGGNTETIASTSKTLQEDPFSRLLANVVKDSSILQKNEPIKKATATAKNDSSVAKVDSSVAKVDSSIAKVDSPVAKVDSSVAKVDSTIAKVDSPIGKVDSSIAKVDSPVAKVDSPVAKVDSPVSKVDSRVAKVDSPVSKVDSTVAKVDVPVAKGDSSVAGVDSMVAVAEKTTRSQLSPASRFFSKKNRDGREMIYIDHDQNVNDTIRIFIPLDESIVKAGNVETGLVQDTKSIALPTDTTSKADAQPVAQMRSDTDLVVSPEKRNMDENKEKDSGFAKKMEGKQPEINAPDLSPTPANKEGNPKRDEMVVLPKVVGSSSINSDCKAFASNEDFLKLRKKMASENSDDNMFKVAKKTLHSKCFSTEQIKNLSFLFLTNEGKYRFFDLAYQFASDSDQYSTLQSQLTDSYYINRFKAMIHK